MEMNLSITIEKIEAVVRIPTGRNDNILAFGELWFYESDRKQPLFKVKGFTIRRKQFGDKEVESVSFPAYGSAKSKSGFQTSFVFENDSLLQDVRTLFLNTYKEKIEASPFKETNSEDIDPDDIPF